MATTLSSVGVVVCLAFTAALAGAGPAGAAPTRAAAPVVHSTRAAASNSYPGGGIYAYGDAVQPDPPTSTLPSPVVAMVAAAGGTTGSAAGGTTGSAAGGTTGSAAGGTSTGTTSGTGAAAAPASHGFWLASADGAVTDVDGAPSFGSVPNLRLYAPVVGMAATPDGGGYWLVALDGAVLAFGDAVYYGSMVGRNLAQPVVGMAATPDGRGYWLVAANGAVFAFGDAVDYGSMAGHRLAQPVVGIAATPDGHGYWLVAADGGVFSFGDARFYGSLGAKRLAATISSMAVTPGGTGYWLLESNGAVFPFGTARSSGDPHRTGAPASAPFKSIVATADGGGYWLLEPDGFRYSFANPTAPGGYPVIVAEAASQIGPDPDDGYFCNPYGPCEPWCALFVTWAWQRAGVPVPSYGFVGSIYYWAARHGRVLGPGARPVRGDAVLYGTGPQTAATAVHTGVVAEVWPDGAIVTIEGDAGPGAVGHLAVVVNGPFLPGDSGAFANYPVFGFAQP